MFLFLLLWVVVSNSGLVKPLFLPSPQAVLSKFMAVATEGFAGATLLEHTLTSLARVMGAFGLACVTAIPIGVLMGVSRIARGIFDPPIEFYRPLPPLAYLPMVIIWFGIGEFSKVYLIFLAIFAPMAIAARSGVRSVSIEQIHAAYSMGATRMQVIRHVILKSALPEIFTGMRIGIGVGWTSEFESRPRHHFKMNDTQFEFFVDGRPVVYQRKGLTGESMILTPDGQIPLDNVLNPFTHFSFRLVKCSSCRVYDSEVVIEKTRPLFLAAFRPSKYKVFVNGEFVTVHEG